MDLDLSMYMARENTMSGFQLNSKSPQVLWGSASLFGGFPALGALRCFVVAACAHVCCGPGVRIRAGVFCRVAMLSI